MGNKGSPSIREVNIPNPQRNNDKTFLLASLGRRLMSPDLCSDVGETGGLKMEAKKWVAFREAEVAVMHVMRKSFTMCGDPLDVENCRRK